VRFFLVRPQVQKLKKKLKLSTSHLKMEEEMAKRAKEAAATQ